MPLRKKTCAPTKIRNNKEECIRSTCSSLLLTSLLTKGIQAEEILEYGWYIGFVTHIIWAGSLHFLHLLLVYSFQTCQPIQPPFPLACINSLNFYRCPLWDCACVCTATQLTVFSTSSWSIQNDSVAMRHFCNSFWHVSHKLRVVQLVEALHYNIRHSGIDSQQGPCKFYSDLNLLYTFNSLEVY